MEFKKVILSEESPFPMKQIKSIEKMLYKTKGFYVKTFRNKEFIDNIRLAFSLPVDILPERNEDRDNISAIGYTYIAENVYYELKYSTILYHEKLKRAIILLPRAIIALDIEDIDSLARYLAELELAIFNKFNNEYSYIDAIISLEYGAIFFLGKNLYDNKLIIERVTGQSWKKITLNDLGISGIAKINEDNDKNSSFYHTTAVFLIFPPEQITNYIINKLAERYGVVLKKKIRKMKLQEKVKELTSPYKEIIEKFDYLFKVHGSLGKYEIKEFQLSKNPSRISIYLLDLLLREELNISLFDDHYYVTFIGKKLIITRFTFRISYAFYLIEKAIEEKFKIGSYYIRNDGSLLFVLVDNSSKRRYLKWRDIKIRAENDYGSEFKISAKKRGNLIIIDEEQLVEFVRSIIENISAGLEEDEFDNNDFYEDEYNEEEWHFVENG